MAATETAAHDTEHLAGGDGRRPRRVREVDFSKPNKIAPDQQRRLERAHESFCRGASTRLSAELRSGFLVEIVDCEQVTWAAALSRVPEASIYLVLVIEETETEIALAAEVRWLLRVFECLLGGSGRTVLEREELTEIELVVTRRVLYTLAEQLALTWEDLLGVTLAPRRLEPKVANLHMAPASEPSLRLQFTCTDRHGEGALSLLVPYRSIESVAGRLAGAEFDSTKGREPDEGVRRTLSEVEVELRAEVAAVELPLTELLALRPGSVLPLGVAPDTGVTLYANTVPIHRARPGRSGPRRAAEILERLEGAR